MERSKDVNRGGHEDDTPEEREYVFESLTDPELVHRLTDEREAYDPETVALLEEEADFRGGLEQLIYLVDEDEDHLMLPAGRGARLLAQILDGVALAAAIGLGAINGVGMAVGLAALFLLFQVYLLSSQGQTIGKSLMKIRIVREDDETNPGFWRAVFLRIIVTGLLGSIPFFSLADILFIFREDARCIHDHIAGTKVIDERGA